MLSYSDIPNTLLVLSLLLFLSPPFIHKPHNLVAAHEHLISAACRGSTDPPTCLSCVKSNPGARKANKTGIASIVLNCIDGHACNLKASFTSLVSKTQDQTLKGIYQSCIGKYSVNMKLVASAQKALERHRNEAANRFLGKAFEFSSALCHHHVDMHLDKVPYPVVQEIIIFEELCTDALRIIQGLP
ncbi:hypothetical protein L6164_022821 [Bauhinia variegata]|uniref:Uncharacterized protein n=1 Tax=Bauhinia variegata TaxID=167791 RepID=A0ACB9MI94_BAUVA|nr:hypothetical protein L6164_022821 [Bauhinia variegata]